MNITIFGANGGIGRLATSQALDTGHRVTAVVRTLAGFGLTHPALTVVIVPGLTDPEVLRPAVKTADAVISAVGPRGRKAGTIASSATRAILRTMELEGVRRIVAISAAPIGPMPDGGVL